MIVSKTIAERRKGSNPFKNTKKYIKMATKIAIIPTLYDKEAENFIKKADEAYRNKGSIDFSKQIEICNEIIKKSRLKLL
jgi:hypothetical protein